MKLVKSNKYYFDKVAAERPIKFIEQYLCHYEDKYAGKPFILCDWERELVRDVFGWKHVESDLRRFRRVYIEIGKGSGKSPLLAAIGIYMLVADGERGPQILSVASDFQQANITFDCAKRMIEHSPKLAKLLEATQYKIECKRNNGTWKIISGKPSGKHGLRPTCILADEIHEWPDKGQELITALNYNADKRSQPLFFLATNAGPRREGLCWRLHEQATKVLDGTSSDETLYSCIYAAGEKDDPGSPATWAKAIPSLGVTITEDKLRDKWEAAKGDPSEEAEFQRLYLSRWVDGGRKKLFDMAEWAAAEAKLPYKRLQADAAPLYLGLDVSLNDDMTAIGRVWVDDQKLRIDAKLWMPRVTANRYEDSHGIEYTNWAANHVKLLDEETISPAVHERLANYVISLSKKYNLQAVCYDAKYAHLVVSLIERAGIPCIPVPQKFNLAEPCEELQRRLKDKTVTIAANPCLKWQAGNVEIIKGKYGDYRIAKPGASEGSKGRRSQKIDGITAIVTAISRAKKHGMQEESETWTGGVYIL